MQDRIQTVLEYAARAGYAARGFVYVNVGVLAVLAALERIPTPAGSTEAITTMADWPLGQVWLTAIAFGLTGFSAWRGLQAVIDADRQGTRPKALAARAGQAVSGLVYGSLAFSIFEAVDALEDVREMPTESARESAARLLELPLGGTLLLLVGLFVAGVGVAGLLRGAFGDFRRRLVCRDNVRDLAEWLGRTGYAGRGLAFLPLGFFLIEAGLDRDAGEARNLGQTLQFLERQPFGSAVLALVAAGLIAFGLYAFMEARYRRINVPDPT